MNSSTRQHSTSKPNIEARTAPNTVTRNFQRRKFDITPIKLADFRKELEEANEKRTFNLPVPLEDESEESESDTVEQAKEEKQPPKADSFHMDFSVLTLETPLKSKRDTKTNDLVTPKIQPKSNYITPQPKIQCTVDMQPYIKTPINNLVAPRHSIKSSEIQAPINKLTDITFKRIYVNSVEYVILNQLGRGGSSEVYHCYNGKEKTHRAIKCVSLHDEASAAGFINEVKMLKSLQKCNHIIKMFDYELNKTAKTLLVVLEVGGSDLSKILRESALCTQHMPMYMLLYYWMEMLYAVREIHTHGIIHSDLKPANFLKVGGFLKLIDFGIATCIQSDMTSVIKTVPEGSFNYISPEALNNESSSNVASPSYGKPQFKISYKSDVWSLGCILYQIVYRKTPFQHITQMWVKLAKIVDPNHKIDYPEADWVPVRIINTIKKCLQHNMKSRPSVDQLIQEYENIFHSL